MGRRSIDAQGMVVAPGSSTCSDSLKSRYWLTLIAVQDFSGHYYEITGEGGSSHRLILHTALRPFQLRALKITAGLTTFRQYFARLEKQGLGIN